MDRTNTTVDSRDILLEDVDGRKIGSRVLLNENVYLRRENKALHQENEKLREIFRIGVVEFERREKEIKFLKEELAKYKERITQLEEENERLKKRIEELEGKNRVLTRIAFGKKNEKRHQGEIKPTKRGRKKGHKGVGREIPENLPVEEEIIELPEEERYCPICGAPLKEIDTEEISREVCVKKTYYLKIIKRKKYKKSCSCPHPIITAPCPSKLIPKSKFSSSFWIDVLINKYKNHIPVERQVSDMAEYGLEVKSGTIFLGLKKLYLNYIQNLYAGLIKSIRENNHFYSDETGWKLFAKVDEKKNYNWFVWVYVGKKIVVFVIDGKRSSHVPLKILFDIDEGEEKFIEPYVDKKIMSVDKFSSYKVLEKLGLVKLAYCWAHQRREFIQIKTKYPEITEWACSWIEKIAEIYHINNERIKHILESPYFAEYDRKLRKEINKMWELINQKYTHPGQIEIMESMKKHWKGLTLFVDNPEIPMDNNLAERMLRKVVLGRKNYWGNHSLWASNLSMAMFSIIGTCQLNNISPRKYLRWYFENCMGREIDSEQLEEYLPHKIHQDVREKIEMNPP